MKVYLAGPITGLTYAEGQDWRLDATYKLRQHGIEAYSPLRAKEYLASHGKLEGSYDEFPLSTAKGIVARDRNDVMTADAILFNLLDAQRMSIGTCIEFGWADAFRKPIFVAMEKSGNCHAHPMLENVSHYVTHSLDDAIDLIRMVLKP